jgi:hypothetical protein
MENYFNKCHFYAEATMPNKRKRKLDFKFEDDCFYASVKTHATIALNKRLRKPHLWVGVQCVITMGEKQIDGVIEYAGLYNEVIVQ